MYEALKTNKLRGPDFLETYLSGRVLDIGSGKALVVPHAEGFDKEDGDVNLIDEAREIGAYDAVHSSHSLEHMRDPEDAIRRWWRLVKPGGHLIIVVPEEDLYEQGNWPSLFQEEHTCTFRLDRATTWSPRSFDIRALAEALPGAEVVSAELQDAGYDHDLKRIGKEVLWSRFLRRRYNHLLGTLSAKKLLSLALIDEPNRMMFDLGAVVDQTMGSALAQIQIVIRKDETA
jgi:SAM-dependent methyltransferase